MSGHSKWAQIKRQKAVTDAKRSHAFTKLANAITIAARQGGEDAETNFKLRLAIDKAKQANMPKDNIARAITRGSGKNDEQHMEQLVYEGYGPDKIGVIIEAVTENRNRTVSNLKHIFSKYGGSLANTGSVAWMFEQKGIITCPQVAPLGEDQIMVLLEAGADDWEEQNGDVMIVCPHDALQPVSQAVSHLGLHTDSVELAYLPKETVPIKNQVSWKSFTDELEDDDDINNYYSNAEN